MNAEFISKMRNKVGDDVMRLIINDFYSKPKINIVELTLKHCQIVRKKWSKKIEIKKKEDDIMFSMNFYDDLDKKKLKKMI